MNFNFFKFKEMPQGLKMTYFYKWGTKKRQYF